MRHFDPFEWLNIAKDVGLLLVSAGAGAWAWFRTRHAYSWPSAHGTIMTAHVQRNTDYYLKSWTAVLSYSYSVNGGYYSGFYQFPFSSERRAEEKIAGW